MHSSISDFVQCRPTAEILHSHFLVCRPTNDDELADVLTAVEQSAAAELDVTAIVIATGSSSHAAAVVAAVSSSAAGHPAKFDGMTLMGSAHRTVIVRSDNEEELLRHRLAEDSVSLHRELWIQTHLDFKWDHSTGASEYEWVWWGTRLLPRWIRSPDGFTWPPCVHAIGNTELCAQPLSDTIRDLIEAGAAAPPPMAREHLVTTMGLVPVFAGWLLAVLLTENTDDLPLRKTVDEVREQATEHGTRPLTYLVRLSEYTAYRELIGRPQPTDDVIQRLRDVAGQHPRTTEDWDGEEWTAILSRFRAMRDDLVRHYLIHDGLFCSDPLAASALGAVLVGLEDLLNTEKGSGL